MRRMGIVRRVLVSLAVVGVCLPNAVLAAGVGADGTPAAVDVALTGGGVLLGKVIDPQGAAVAKVPVSLREQDREIATAVTDDQGYFTVGNLRGGVYQIVAAEGHGTYRLWAPGTAPPTAQQGALVMAGQNLVRGQCYTGGCAPCGGALGFWLCNPWVIAGIVATAVTVPVVIHNTKDGPASP